MSSLDELCKDARTDLKDWLLDTLHIEPHDTIGEIADSSVPIYYSDLFKLAESNYSLLTEEPDLGPAFDGANTPINIIAANAYEYVQNDLWEYHREWERELEHVEEELAWAECEIDEYFESGTHGKEAADDNKDSHLVFLEGLDNSMSYDTKFFDIDWVNDRLWEFYDRRRELEEVDDKAG